MFYKAATLIADVNTNSPKVNEASTRFTEAKTDSRKLYQDATHFEGAEHLIEALRSCINLL